MKQSVGSGLLVEIVHACAIAENESMLFKGVLPELRELAGADLAVVIARGPEGPVLAHSAGTDVTAEELALAPGAGRDTVPVPDSWAVAGITHVVAQQLAGHLGTLALGWSASPAEDPGLSAALDSVTGAATRLDVSAALADLVQRVDSAQHLASMGDYDWHIPTDTNRWSDQLYRIYGHEPQAFNASYEKFLSCIHPDDRERIQGVHQQAYATGEPYQMIERIIRPDGEVRYLSSNGEVIMDANGAPVRMRGTCIDVTERMLAEQERERISERFRGLVEASPDAILVFGADGVVLQANGRAVAMLGGDPAGRRVTEILPGGSHGGQAVAAVRLDGQDLVLDVTTAELSETDHQRRTAAFLIDATKRLEREAMATRLGELQQRRRQALEINDNIVQGLSSANYALDAGDITGAESYVSRTLTAARNMMDDLLEPSGQQLEPGDLVRSRPTALEPRVTGSPEIEPVAEGERTHKILIVDDADDIRMLLRLKIGTHDSYEVVGEAADGVDAVDLARALQPNLVLLDMAMPRMDGLQALPLIREAVPGVRVIVLSGFNQSTLEQEAIAAGADRYVVKGGPMKELLEVIAAVLDAA